MSGSNGRAERRRAARQADQDRMNQVRRRLNPSWQPPIIDPYISKGGALLRNMKPRLGISKRLGYKPK